MTPAQRMHGRHLAWIHELHLRQIGQVEALIALIDNGLAKQQEAADAMAALDMSRNYKAFGGLCYQECQFLDFHHTSEDEAIFPALRRGNAGLDAVLDRLAGEHVAIHGWIERLLDAAVAFADRPDPARYEQLRATFQTLAGLVKSHFGYEQGELEEALGLFGAPL